MKKIIILLIIFPFIGKTQATLEFTAGLKEAHRRMVEMRFDEARAIVKTEEKFRPENAANSYIKAAVNCIELFVSEDRNAFEAQRAQIEGWISELENAPESPLRETLIGELRICLGSLHGKLGNQLPAAWQFYKAYDRLNKSFAENADFEPLTVPLGVLYAAIGSLPEDYKKIASLLGFEGDVEKGRKMLKNGFENLDKNSSYFFRKDYYGFVHCFVCQQLDSDCMISPALLGLKIESSPFLIFLEAKHFLERNSGEQALAILKKRPTGNEYADFPYLDYLIAKTAAGVDGELSKKLFLSYLESSKTQNFKKSSYRYLAWLAILENDFEEAERRRQNVLKLGAAKTGADRQSVEEAERGFNPVLVKSRLFFDAGKLQETDSLLMANPIEKCCEKPWERQEYLYRKGRTAQANGMRRAARLEYEKALAQNGPKNTYAWGNINLQLGVIYESYDNLEMAKVFYEKALDSDGYAFYEGIHQLALAALQRLENR